MFPRGLRLPVCLCKLLLGKGKVIYFSPSQLVGRNPFGVEQLVHRGCPKTILHISYLQYKNNGKSTEL